MCVCVFEGVLKGELGGELFDQQTVSKERSGDETSFKYLQFKITI